MTESGDPVNPGDGHKRPVITEHLSVGGDVHGPVLNQPTFNAPVDFGDKIVLPEAKPRPTSGLYGVPELPTAFLSRPEVMGPIRQSILARQSAGGRAMRLGLQGMGGIGKSTLAAALARERQVQESFPDGIFWIALGQQPDLLGAQAALANLLETNTHTFLDVRDGRSQLERMLRARCCLLILDDAWRPEHAEAFNCLDASARAGMLITTRNQELVSRLQAGLHTLPVLTLPQSLDLLAQWVGLQAAALPVEAAQAADECGHLPLALAMAGAMAAQKGWRHALERLRRADLDRIQTAFPDYPYPNLLRALQASLDDLDSVPELARLEARRRYLQLAVFPEDVVVPAKVITTLWGGADGLDDLDSADLLDALQQRALLQKDASGGYSLHDLQRDFLQRSAGDLAALQAAFLDALRPLTTAGQWHTLPADGYLLQNLAWHLRQAGRGTELEELLCDYRWLAVKLARTSIHALLRDFDEARRDLPARPGDALSLLQSALRLSAHVLIRDRQQLSGQLLARLLSCDQPQITALLTQAEDPANTPRTWLRPLGPALKPPGGAERFTLTGHTNLIPTVAVTPDGRLAVSGSLDGSVRLWDLSRPDAEPLHLLEGDAWISQVSLAADHLLAVVRSRAPVWVCDLQNLDAGGRELPCGQDESSRMAFAAGLAVCADADGTLTVWDLMAPERPPRRFAGAPPGAFLSLAVSANGRRAAASSDDSTLTVWDLANPDAPPLTFWEIDTRVYNLSFSPDGDRLAGVRLRGDLVAYNLAHPDLPVVGLVPSGATFSPLLFSPDGRTLYFSSRAHEICQWDLSVPDGEVRPLFAHSDLVNTLALDAAGRVLVSGAMDNTLMVRDLIDLDAPARCFRGHANSVTAVAVTPDGRLAVSGSIDCTLKLWDLTCRDPEPVNPSGHTGSIDAVRIAPDGRRALSASTDGSLRLWDLTAARPQSRLLAGHAAAVCAAAITADGQRAVSASKDFTLGTWDLSHPEQPLAMFPGYEVSYSLTISADGGRAICRCEEHSLQVWNLGRPDPGPARLPGHSGFISDMALTPDGRLALTASLDQTLRLWDLDDPAAPPRLLAAQAGGVMAAALNADGKLALSGHEDGSVIAWDLGAADPQPRRAARRPAMVDAIRLAPDGSRALVLYVDHALELIDLTQPDAPARTLLPGLGYTRIVALVVQNFLSMTPDGRLGASVSVHDGTVRIWDLADARCLAAFTLQGTPAGIDLAHDGRTLIAGDATGGVYLLRLEGF